MLILQIGKDFTKKGGMPDMMKAIEMQKKNLILQETMITINFSDNKFIIKNTSRLPKNKSPFN
jgi:hypothetical protein